MNAAPVELPEIQRASSVGALGILRAFRSDILGAFSANFFTDLRVSFRSLGHHFVCLNDPDDIDHVLNTHMQRYQPNVLARRLLEPIVGQGLLFSEGDEWRRQHGQLAPFFQPRSIERLIPSFHETALNSIASWPASQQFERNLLLDFRRLTLAIITRSLLSIDDERGTAQLAEFASKAESSGALLGWRDCMALLGWNRIAQPPKRRDIAAQWRAWVEALLDSRPPIDNVDEARDILDLLRAGGDGRTAGVAPRQEIVDQVGTMLSAGFITTALALFWTVLILALFPSHQEAVRRDLCRGEETAAPKWSALRSSQTATAFLYESLRLFPPAYVIVREAQVDDRIGNLRIPRGAAVIIAPWVVHRHAAHWREPDRFDPSRFLQHGRLATPPAWMPYGVGPRVCIGASFATMEMLVVLRCLLSRYQVRLRGRPPRPVGRITLTPDFQPLFTLTRL